MKPIKIEVHAQMPQSADAICQDILNMDSWSTFTGYGLLPGIKSAHFELKTAAWVGSRIKVHNTDGSSHVEEIVAWDPPRRIALKFQAFDSPLRYLAAHFLETWQFQESANGTAVSRTMALYPKNVVGRIILTPISRLMKKALAHHLQAV